MDGSSFPFKLQSCVWEITLACCFNCAYCGSRAGKARENELNTAECLDVARQLGEMGCRRVSLIGGEVFMRPDWAEIAAALTSRSIKTAIITNGFKMSAPVIEKLKRIGIESVAVSLDGPRRVHDAFRQKGSYTRAVNAVFSLARAGIPVSVISALRADNAPLLAEFYDEIKSFPLFAWQIQACSPMGYAGSNNLNVGFDAKKVIDFVYRTVPDASFWVGVADNIGYYTPEEGVLRGKSNSFFEGCSAGLTTIGIDSTGNVRGCESMYDERFTEGNLRERSLEDIWTSPNAFAYNRRFEASMLGGGCKGCVHGEYCAGGCRSYNYFTTGNLYQNALCPNALK
ncbi:MAG: radical SAM protein [Ruminococcus sp.]|nr:radical SAM protein [Ruminococcus sp.]